jgi:predicted XRE-type DNA-binding protein
MTNTNHKPRSLFEREMQNESFRTAYESERESFALEVQILKLLESSDMSLADVARALGVPRSNITRDLSQGRIRRATLPHVAELANAANADFVPVILPRDPQRRRNVLRRLSKVFAVAAVISV